MKSRNRIIAVLTVLVFCLIAASLGAGQNLERGKLIVRVLQGDDNSPARDAFVYVRGHLGQESTSITPTKPGWFEISLQPGLYDVFVSEGSSLPMCKRIEIKPVSTRMYTAKLELDEDHLQN